MQAHRNNRYNVHAGQKNQKGPEERVIFRHDCHEAKLALFSLERRRFQDSQTNVAIALGLSGRGYSGGFIVKRTCVLLPAGVLPMPNPHGGLQWRTPGLQITVSTSIGAIEAYLCLNTSLRRYREPLTF